MRSILIDQRKGCVSRRAHEATATVGQQVSATSAASPLRLLFGEPFVQIVDDVAAELVQTRDGHEAIARVVESQALQDETALAEPGEGSSHGPFHGRPRPGRRRMAQANSLASVRKLAMAARRIGHHGLGRSSDPPSTSHARQAACAPDAAPAWAGDSDSFA